MIDHVRHVRPALAAIDDRQFEHAAGERQRLDRDPCLAQPRRQRFACCSAGARRLTSGCSCPAPPRAPRARSPPRGQAPRSGAAFRSVGLAGRLEQQRGGAEQADDRRRAHAASSPRSSASRWWMSTPPAAKPASFTMRRCSGRLVATPSTRISESATRRRASASARVAPWTISLAIRLVVVRRHDRRPRPRACRRARRARRARRNA